MIRPKEAYDPEVHHHFSNGVYAKEYRLAAGHTAITHKHNYPHMSILAQGEVVVTVEKVNPVGSLSYPLRAPEVIEIAAGLNHSIRAVTDTVWYCIHATDETDVEKIDQGLKAD